MNVFERWIILIVCFGFLCFFFTSQTKRTAAIENHPKLIKKPIAKASDKERSEGKSNQPTSDTIETALGVKTYSELEEAIFRPMGYKLRENLLIPGLDYNEPLNCPKIFSDWLANSKNHNESGTPPRTIPSNLKDQYTLKGLVHLIEGYRDDRSGTNNLTWTKDQIDSYVKNDEKRAPEYGNEVKSMYYAMKDYGVEGKGLVVGSLTPYVEGFALKAGAKHMTTAEYSKINIVGDDRVDYKHPVEIATNSELHIGAYDFVASFSSIEHSGLGRYGDALDPIGDLMEARKISCMLKDKGLFFIGFPTGWDTLHWNLHRIYGRIRLALFTAGFDVLGVYYNGQERNVTANLEMFKRQNQGAFTQRLLVLRKR